MNPPFTAEQFMNVFREYNVSVWPMQVVFYVIGFLIIIFAFWKYRFSDVVINILLALVWLWMGIVYHFMFFSAINKAAYFFGAVFILQALLFIYYGIIKHSLIFKAQDDIHFVAGIVFIIYSFAIYPILGILLGHQYPTSPTLGLPCPTTIFTLGVLLWTDKKLPIVVIIIPLIWSVIGFTAVFNFGIREDTGLLITGIVAGLLLVIRRRKGMIEQRN
jgi:hypothetical protein